ncbi:TonB-dependent receptor [Govanella unica]|uniref:TonB-dependent receptor n=1 Tax=Govanella unica TaxID=2975056 RepID=A0A9X3Z6A8_9PROT|nr:TonB-dependent receptor [Govania unica]MDA5192887.1 TonB-dependent receptor [Govania unica]
MRTNRHTLAVSVSLYALMATGAYAQSHEGMSENFDEVIVTARKKVELLQDIPVSIQAFSETQIERMAIRDVGDVSKYSPSIIFDKASTPDGGNITIRGLAPTRGRASAAILVDGIDVSSEAIASPGGGILLSTKLLDIQRIEIVRGPHSVDYGRSAFAGAIQYVTKDPSDELSGDLHLGIGSHGRYDVNGGVSGPLVEGKLSGRVSAAYWTRNGFYRDQATLSRLGKGEGFGTSGTLLFTPNDSLSVKARLEYFEDKASPEAQYLVRSNSGLIQPANNPAFAQAVAGRVVSASPFAIFTGMVPNGRDLGRPLHSPDPLTGGLFRGFDRDVLRGSLIANWTVGSGTISSWTSATTAHSRNRQDYDQDAILSGPIGSQIDIAQRTSVQDTENSTKQFSQELRYASEWNSPVQMNVGGLFWTEKAKREAHTVIVTCATNVPACVKGASGLYANLIHTPDNNSRDTDHWSAYGTLAWAINDQWKLSAEGRYSHEKEVVVGTNCGLPVNKFGVICGDPFATSAFTPPVYGPSSVLGDRRTVAAMYGVPTAISTKNNYFTPRFILEWKPEDNKLIYISAAKGVKPGGTSTVAAGAWFDTDLDGDFDELAFDSEVMWSYELGGKFTWADGRVLTNFALFYQDYSNKQVVSTTSTPSGYPVAIIENAGAARIQGLEFEGMWRVTPEFRLSVGYTYLDTKYTSFTVRSDSKSTVLTAPACKPVFFGGKQLCELDLSGNKLEKTPKHSLVLGANYTASAEKLMSGASWFVEANAIYQSRRFVDQSNLRTLGSYWMGDVRTGISTDRWDLTLYVDNLFDDRTVKSADVKTGDVDREILGLASSSSAVLATLPDPRTFGLRSSFKF